MAKKKAQKTNAARILDRLGIDYELLTYPVDENDLSANHVAEVTGIPPERIYKTLVVRGDRTGVFMAVNGRRFRRVRVPKAKRRQTSVDFEPYNAFGG